MCRDAASAKLLMDVPLESVIQISGEVKARKQKAKAAAGEVSVSPDQPAESGETAEQGEERRRS